MNMQQIRKALSTELKRLEAQRVNVRTAMKALSDLPAGRGQLSTSSVTIRRKPKFTRAGLERIAAAQRARWAKVKAARARAGHK
jgi:hypothetical protein